MSACTGLRRNYDFSGREKEDENIIYSYGLLRHRKFPAFLPQFIEPAYPHTMLSFILLGGTFIVTGTLWCLFLAIYAAHLSALMHRGEQRGHLPGKVSGILFIGLGVKLAVLEQ